MCVRLTLLADTGEIGTQLHLRFSMSESFRQSRKPRVCTSGLSALLKCNRARQGRHPEIDACPCSDGRGFSDTMLSTWILFHPAISTSLNGTIASVA